jgi:Protein of unknown function (DUF2975)
MIIDMGPEPPSRAVTAGYRIASVLLAIAVGFGVLWVASITLDIVQGGDTVQVPVQLSPEDVGPLPEGIHVAGWPDLTVEVADPTTKQTLLQDALAIGPGLLVIAGLWLLRGFLRSVLAGDPFGARNVQRLRNLGLLLAAGTPLVALVDTALRNALFDELPPYPSLDLGSAGFSLPLGALVGGLGAFILAEVFAYGGRLREDVEATI